jgi:hypothetical protein
MGLRDRLGQWAFARWLRGKLEGKPMERIEKAVEWLNAVPGRKRGLAAILLGASAAVRAFGHTEAAQSIEAINEVAQTYLVPGMDVVGFVFAVVGVWHSKARKG